MDTAPIQLSLLFALEKLLEKEFLRDYTQSKLRINLVCSPGKVHGLAPSSEQLDLGQLGLCISQPHSSIKLRISAILPTPPPP